MKCVFLAAALLAGSFSNTAANPFLREMPADRKLEFRLEDKLRMPGFAWPRTLLSYPVRFPSPVQYGQWRLRDKTTGAEQPVQFSEVSGNFAIVHFFADLPSGGFRSFELIPGEPQSVTPGVGMTQDGNTIVINGGRLKVRIPATQKPGADVPGPILALNEFGDSRLISPRRKVFSLKTETIDVGPLFLTLRVTYRFEGGGEYAATVRVTAGYDHIGFHEEIRGLSIEDGVFVEQAWKHFHTTHRMIIGSPFGGIRRVDDPIIQPFRGEDPAFTGPSRIEDPAVEMLPSLTPYWPNGMGGNRSASFWDERSGDALGLFVADASMWQDHQYAIWTSADSHKVKYRFADGVLFWKWPLVTGTRFTGLTTYHHDRPPAEAPLADQTPGATWKDDVPDDANHLELPVKLQIQYGDISLDRVKDWVLSYPDNAAKPPGDILPPGRMKSIGDYMKGLPDCAMSKVAQGMFHPVGLRDMHYWVAPDFARFRDEMTAEQREQATAAILFAAYVAAEDEYAPMRTMLGGHPNFMSDLKYPIAAAAFLFPDHPMAREWRGQFARFMELSGIFHVRPSVPRWNALGGRFTESIATYQWAFLGPAAEANHLGSVFKAPNVFATPNFADMGDYLTGILTSPQHKDRHATSTGIPQTFENGFRRLHPPQGAHSGKRGAPGPMYALGQQLRQYRPLTAEHLMWGAFPSAGEGFEGRHGVPGETINRGTNPHLTSAKFTGYGIVLRAGVDTPDEISVFLQQIDKGPNYRWGYANQNGSGDLYYYADGKSYSGHEREEAGDGHVDDALLSSNTGVYKDHHFKSIGMNELTRPLHNLECAQFAEIVPDTGPAAYSWPEYQSRSVMLVGTDYIVTHDRILAPCGTRFAWNITPDDEMPFIHTIKGAEGMIDLTDTKTGFVRGSFTTMIKGGGSHTAIVTHKADVGVIKEKRAKGKPAGPYVKVRAPGGTDLVFQTDEPVTWQEQDIAFTGTAGVIRKRDGKATQLALFRGTRIGAGGVVLQTDNPELGISASFSDTSEISGIFSSESGGTLNLQSPRNGVFHIDGKPSGFRLPPGTHRWEFTKRLPEPMPPMMLRTENRAGGTTVFFTKVASADRYRLELSHDNGSNWREIGETREDHFELKGLSDGTKVHVRATALNRERASRPAAEYPVYISSAPPLPPDGLKVEILDDAVALTWGEVLGVTGYRLYRRDDPAGKWREIFHGSARSFVDSKRLPAPRHSPGLRAAAYDNASNHTVCEYAVAAINGNGEGERCAPVDTDPASWRNWSPSVTPAFKRQSAFWLPPYVRPEEAPPPAYPTD